MPRLIPTLKYMLISSLLMFAIGCSSSQEMSTTTTQPVVKESNQSWLKLDTVKAQRFDTGKMWTFDFPPVEYFKEAYNFTLTDDWLNNVRMSALRFANYCSASFVSGDGLVMTNHHCARESVTEVTMEGEDLHKYGFYAEKLEDERKVPGLYVDQLVLIEDVTKEIHNAIDEGKTDEEKAANKKKKSDEIVARYKENTGLEIQVISFYNGGKYSVYGFKRYNDVRLVFAPETELGYFGGDPDNFTYPRYSLDCSFFRVYDDEGNPLKTEHFFKWSPNGAKVGEPVFVVGNPGRTNRLFTVAQLEYQRDFQYPLTLLMLNQLENAYKEMLDEYPERSLEFMDTYFGFANSRKAFTGILSGLRDPYLMQRKVDFEASFKAKIDAKPELKAKYGHLWDAIKNTRYEISKIAYESNAYNMAPIITPQYFGIAKNIITWAEQMKLPEEERLEPYKGDMKKETAAKLFPDEFDTPYQNKILSVAISYLTAALGENNALVKKFTGGKKGKEAVQYCLNNSKITSKEKVDALISKGFDAILNSDDPFIYYILNSRDKSKELSGKIREIVNKESDYVQLLGRAFFEIYGTSIPPDATFSLRLADGVVQGYDYNGTTAPAMTTYYGMYDRYFSFDGKEPWSLPERWQNPPAEFDLHTPVNFVSTNDIIGGNSGSPVINKNAEVVGLAFDGNIESLPGQFIFTTETNRTVSVHSAGMLEALKDLYKAKRISDELKNGRLSGDYLNKTEKMKTKE